MTLWTLHAAYDPEAQIWHTFDCDVPGLVTEGDTLEHLRDRAMAVMPELLIDKAGHIPEDRRNGPIRCDWWPFTKAPHRSPPDAQLLWPRSEAHIARS